MSTPASPMPSAAIPLTHQTIVPRGAAWQVSRSTIRTGLLRRPFALIVAFVVFVVLGMLGGTEAPRAVLQALIGCAVVIVLSLGLAWLRVRRWYRAGATWRGGIGQADLRIVFPDNDLTLPAAEIRQVRLEPGLMMLSIGPRALQLGLPEGLFTPVDVEAAVARAQQLAADAAQAGPPPADPLVDPSIDASADPSGDAAAERAEHDAQSESPGLPAEPVAATPPTPVAGQRRDTVITGELARSIPRTLSRLELSRPLSLFLLVFALFQLYRGVAYADSLSLLIAGMAGLSWVALGFAPYLQGRRLYQEGMAIGAGVGGGRLSVRLGERLIDEDVAVVRKVVRVREGFALRLANGGVLIVPAGLLSDEQVVVLATARATRRRR